MLRGISKGISAVSLMLVALYFSPAAHAQQDDRDQTIAELKAKVAGLEKRIVVLEKLLAPLQAEAQRKVLRGEFEKRMALDAKKYTKEQIAEAEKLYQVMNEKWRSPEGKAALDQMIQKYPDLNRTGCAHLYLGQVSDGDEKVSHLQIAIEKHSDCMYGDGVQVGAFGRYLLALHYQETGEMKKARTLFDEIRTEFPYAVDHKGRSLEEQIPKE